MPQSFPYWDVARSYRFFSQIPSNTGPKAWNALPAELQHLMDHSAFKRQLKTFLFKRAFTT